MNSILNHIPNLKHLDSGMFFVMPFKDYLCKSVKSVGDSYPKNKYAIAIAAMTPAKSASRPQATA